VDSTNPHKCWVRSNSGIPVGGVSNLDFFQTSFQKNLSQKKVAFQMQFSSHVKKRKGKTLLFQKLLSEKNRGGGSAFRR
jgi:hypothetical protein